MFEKIHASQVTETFLYDSTKRYGGAPAVPNSVRYLEDPTYGGQWYRCMLNESTITLNGTTAGGKGIAGAAGTLWAGETISGLSGTGTAASRFAGVVPYNVSLLNGYWGWVHVRGETLLSILTLSAVNATLETAAAGNFDDTAATGLVIGYQTGATVGGATAATRAYVNVGHI
jgi:hypothetical protein